MDNIQNVPPVQVRDVSLGELMARKAATLIEEKKCADIVVLDVRGIASFTDFFVIATADSERMAKAAADHIIDAFRDEGERPLHVEGLDFLHWVLLDYFNVVIHLFMPEERRFYELETLWSDAPRLLLVP